MAYFPFWFLTLCYNQMLRISSWCKQTWQIQHLTPSSYSLPPADVSSACLDWYVLLFKHCDNASSVTAVLTVPILSSRASNSCQAAQMVDKYKYENNRHNTWVWIVLCMPKCNSRRQDRCDRFGYNRSEREQHNISKENSKPHMTCYQYPASCLYADHRSLSH